jgi:membrane protein implicated in regulation of membrane protease activity
MSFFQDLSPIEIVYWASAIIGGILFLFRTALLFIGGDVGDADAEGDIFDGDSDFSVKLLSLQGLTAFFMMFGLSGLAFVSSGVAEIWSTLGGAGIGLFSVWVLRYIFSIFLRLQSDGTVRLKNAIGQSGKVYLRIPAHGTGQVQVSVQGGLKIYDAQTANEEEITTGENVRVVDVIGESILVVEKLTPKG